ncbi:hypothetical protein AMJ83_11235 [candidate division WOR_3 bacterium SM23_42]|uniref:Uncharacterized protein n=1 Tax=candidate division WOR_3 bacterium SM23_42 TaxID=1703779 RepID=A0A0S8FNP0_UNCW3|nr:MAG: hypothetical protein AMJ83_11235 [candidate division WOR_3 bacterium SM23_42]
MNITSDPWIWIGGLLTLCIFSFLYKDNPFYKFAEHLFVGVANGYFLTFTVHRVLGPNLFVPLFVQGRIWYVISLTVGMLYILRFVPRVSWLVRIPIAVTIGYYTGAVIPATIQADIIRQIQATILTPQNFQSWNAGSSGIIWSVILFVGVACTLSYFYFSREHKGVLGVTSKIGVIFIMVGFGAAFGYTVMARVSLLIGRFQFILGPWFGIIE